MHDKSCKNDRGGVKYSRINTRKEVTSMFYSAYGNYLKSKLKGLLPKDYLITDEVMLLAYTEFWIVYNEFKNNKDVRPVFLEALDDKDAIYYKEVMGEFLGLEYFEFIQFVIPCYILRPESLRFNFFELKKDKDIVDITITILLIKEVVRDLEKNISKNIENKLFVNYEKSAQTKKTEYILNKNDFSIILSDIISFPIDIQTVISASHCQLSKKVFEVTSILNDDLAEPKNKQLEYCAKIHSREMKRTDIEALTPANFCQLSYEEWLKKMYFVYGEIMKLDPLEILCGIHISKKTIIYQKSSKRIIPSNLPFNDIVIENTLAYELFRANFSPKYRDGYGCMILFPTPYFIKKWVKDDLLYDQDVTFVVENIWHKKLYEEYFGTVDYCGVIREGIKFITYEELAEGSISSKESEYAHALIFMNNINDNVIQQDIFQVVEKNSPILNSIYCLSSDDYLQGLIKRDVNITDIILIPKGISSSKVPRVKSFWRFLVDSEKSCLESNINISAAKVITAKYKELMIIPGKNVLSVSKEIIGETGFSLRHLYENIKNDRYNKDLIKREEPHVFKFSREIDFWYSQSENKELPVKYRIKAYICGPKSEYKGEKFLQRGKRIDSSIKGIDNISKEEIKTWLKEVYPFETVRRSGDINVIGNIRDIISGHYRERLRGSNISIRTLWYIYPEISEKISDRESELLEEMAMSSIGEMDLKFSSDEDITDKLNFNYKDESIDTYIRRLNVLSIMISFAITKDHCDKNVIDDLLSENSSSNKAFIEIRKALTKKSFTEEEQKKIYKIVNKKIYEDGKWEYIGVLIKLLTGLESNIVCGLQWDDFVLVEEYGFYKFNIYKQVTNNGESYSGFNSTFDYRCIPCSGILAHYLCKLLENIKMKTLEDLGKRNIVLSIDSWNLERKSTTTFSPDKLNKICRGIVDEIGIVDVHISYSDNIKGTKETNLSRYGGDIFRSNFKYWAYSYAKMTADEVQYLLGNRPDTTFGTYYCDFVNDMAQLSLYVKLRRIDSFLLDVSRNYEEKVKNELDGEVHVFKANGDLPLNLNIIATGANLTDYNIRISNNYGFSLQAVKIK